MVKIQGGFIMRKSIFVLLVILLSAALVSCDQDKATDNIIYPQDGVTMSYVTSRAQFFEVTGILLPELPDLELSDYHETYVTGQKDYDFDIVGGTALSNSTYDTFVKFFLDKRGEAISSGMGETGKYTSWKFDGRGLYCALDYEPLRLRIDTFPLPGGLENSSDWEDLIWP